jgi:hypothetical protein
MLDFPELILLALIGLSMTFLKLIPYPMRLYFLGERKTVFEILAVGVLNL